MDAATLKAWRKAERQRLIAAREALSPAVLDASRRRIDASLQRSFPGLARCRLAFCWPIRGEYDARHLARTLRERGATVESVTCYKRAAPSGDARGLLDALRGQRARALTLTSAEGVDNLVKAAGDEGRALLADIPAFAPHARIVEHARKRGLDARLTAGGDAGLIAGLLEWASARTTREDD